MNKLLPRISAVLLSSLMLTTVGLAGADDPSAVKIGRPAIVSKPVVAKSRLAEGYPPKIQAKLEARAAALKNLPSHPNGMAPRFIINLSKRWNAGQTITVAFKTGTDDTLAKNIADAVNEWTRFANLKFDFGTNGVTGFRSWDPADTSFKADIRVSFDQPGLFSLVGTDSVNGVIITPGQESLNLQQFDVNLPSDWQGVALHEFGHAIGFEHEHQAPGAPCDFRFNDDPGYVPTTDGFGQFIVDSAGRNPGLYTSLGGPPNNWTKATVDFNLQQLPTSHAYSIGPFDKDSIMKYFFESSYFSSGASSPCYTGAENVILSAGDKTGAAKVYPRTHADILAASKVRQEVLQAASKSNEILEAGRQQFRQALDRLKIE